ncbi:MAG TPA: tetratricopeptide repeat protein [Thermodesulfobacteriota bacterium]
MRFVFFKWVLLTYGALSLFGTPVPGLLAQQSPREEIQIFLQRGVEKGLNLDEKGAVAELTKALEMDRKSPVAYAYLAMAYLFSYETGLDEKEKKKSETSLLRAVEDTQTLAEKRLEENPRNADACFSMAIVRMVKNRWEILHRNYFRAFREAQGVWDLLEKTRELDPQNFDVYYPMGVLHYHLAQLSGIARWITSLFITPGDRERGIREFETAHEKGRLMRDLAASSLVSAYSGYEKQPARALPLATKLKEKYPDNYNFSFALVNIYSDLGRYEEAMAVAGEIGNEIKAGKPPYRRELWPRYHQSLGKISLDREEYEKAAEYFKQALKDTAPYNNRVRAWALVRLGMIHDARKERKPAEDYYRKALDLEGAEGMAQRAAREYLETPYSPPTRK